MTVIRETGQQLRSRCAPEHCESLFDGPIREMDSAWDRTVAAARRQNRKLAQCLEESRRLSEGLRELASYLDGVRRDLPGEEEPVAEVSEASQRTSRLMQVREGLDRRKADLEELEAIVKKAGGGEEEEDVPCGPELRRLRSDWDRLTEDVRSRHANCRSAASEYGEFRTLSAQEGDWLDRLDKKLRRGVSAHTAADAEEISEELDDLENFLNNHPEERLARLGELARSLGERGVLRAAPAVAEEAEALRERWLQLTMKAKQRTDVLEGELWWEMVSRTFVFYHLFFIRLHRGGPRVGVQADRGPGLAGGEGHPAHLAPGAGAHRGGPARGVAGN